MKKTGQMNALFKLYQSSVEQSDDELLPFKAEAYYDSCFFFTGRQ